MNKVKILAISGSSRKTSFNTGLINYVMGNHPENVEIEVFDVHTLPMLDTDYATKDKAPESVEDFKKKIEESDALIIATPEYNRSIPGPLKNAIDWASIPFGRNSWEGKVIGIMGASTGGIATAIVHYDLKKVFGHLKAYTVPTETLVGGAGDKFEKGELTDEKTQGYVKRLIDQTVELHNKLK